MADGPLLVFGPRSLTYDFGPNHPLSPRRFGPGIELLRAVGAEPGLAPELAADDELEWLHAADYIATVRRFSADPGGGVGGGAGRLPEPDAGIGPGDDPAFAGMHEAAASVAGGSIRAIEAILGGDVEHAYHPGGGLHHAMRARASGFCIYNDVALAIARARHDGLRVLYVDLDVHHGDGVQALHYRDPGVLTISFHESGRSLFPGSGFVDELGEGSAAGTSVNVPLEPLCGPEPWLASVRAIVPPLAAAFGPDIVVSQHGADGHVWDPLAHLSLTTTAMGEAARLVDRIAHRYARGRWLATGGGGYAVYRVVPRVWALTWLAGAHREAPARLPDDWRARWAGDAARWDEAPAGEAPLPEGFDDLLRLPSERSLSPAAVVRANETVSLVRTVLVPALLSVAEERGWWRPDGAGAETATRAAPPAGASPAGAPPPGSDPAVVAILTADMVERLALSPRVLAPADPRVARELLMAALRDGAVAAGAVIGEWLVGVALAAPSVPRSPAQIDGVDRLVALGVAPEWRRGGLATTMLRALVTEQDRRGHALVALHTVAERDVFDPLPRAVRRGVAESLARASGMTVTPAPPPITAVDADARVASHVPSSASPDLRSSVGEWPDSL
jgi:acetoin utilization protein AcuC